MVCELFKFCNYLAFLVTGSTENLSTSSEPVVPALTSQEDFSSVELKSTNHDEDTKNSQSDSKEDLLNDSSPLLDTNTQHIPTDYGIELSQEDKITLLLQTTDSKLNDIW